MHLFALTSKVWPILGKNPNCGFYDPCLMAKGGLGVKLNGFLDSLYIVLYPSIIHFYALKSIVREILYKNPNSGFNDPCFGAKRVGG